jgi:predicted nucleic acid-binding protein
MVPVPSVPHFRILNTAADGRATLLVSGDKTDLLALKMVEGIPIVSAREAAERLGF